MGCDSNYYIGYHIKVENQQFEELCIYSRKHCSNTRCNNFYEIISGSFCASCGSPVMDSITETKISVTGDLPESFYIRNDEDELSIFCSDNGKFIFLIPNYTLMRSKYGVLTDEFERAGITSLNIIGPFAEQFDEFRESYSSFLKILEEADMKYNIEYGIVKYYY